MENEGFGGTGTKVPIPSLATGCLCNCQIITIGGNFTRVDIDCGILLIIGTGLPRSRRSRNAPSLPPKSPFPFSLSLPHPLIRHHRPISLFLLPPVYHRRSIFTEGDNCKHLSFPSTSYFNPLCQPILSRFLP